VKARGYYLALVTGFVLPFTPYLLYAQLLSTYHTWRWGIWICLIWNGIWFAGILVLYFPQSQTRAKGAAAREILGKIDYVGGFLSITGLVLFLVALQAGGYSHPWASAYVLCTLIIGFLLIVAFVVWELKFCKDPMVPHEMFKGQRIVGMAYGIAFVAGELSSKFVVVGSGRALTPIPQA
jgi:MFS family permease